MSDLIINKAATNSNRKMSHGVYINQILEPYIKEWTHPGDKFELEENGDSGHGGGPTATNNNPVAHWKKEYGLEKYFNCTESPDLGRVENCWQAPQAYVQKQLHYNRQTLMELVIEGWDKVSQPFISEQVHSIPR